MCSRRARILARVAAATISTADYAAQLENKRAILKETLLRNGKLEWKGEIITHSGEPWNYRNRSRLKVRGGADFALGYHRLGSHDLLPIKQCPISSPAINRVLTHMWELGEAGKVPAGITEIEFFADHADSKDGAGSLLRAGRAGDARFRGRSARPKRRRSRASHFLPRTPKAEPGQ